MRLQRYMMDESLMSIIRNIFNTVSRVEKKDIDYQLKISWYDFVDRARKNGTEKQAVEFINRTFHQNIKSLDDVNLSKMKQAIES